MDLKHIIDQKDHYADYMVDEITHICRDFEKREPGSKGEQQACEYMAQVLKKDCGCQRADVESFRGTPGAWLGWIYFTNTFGWGAIVWFLWCPRWGAGGAAAPPPPRPPGGASPSRPRRPLTRGGRRTRCLRP